MFLCCCVIASSPRSRRRCGAAVETAGRRPSYGDARREEGSSRRSRRLYQAGRPAFFESQTGFFLREYVRTCCTHACVSRPGRANRHTSLCFGASTVAHVTGLGHCGIRGPVVHGLRPGSSAPLSPPSTAAAHTGTPTRHQPRLMTVVPFIIISFISRTCFSARIERASYCLRTSPI